MATRSGLDAVAPAAAAWLDRAAARRRFARGELLFRQGEPPGELHRIVRGWVKVARGTAQGAAITLTMLGPDDLAGTLALARATPHTATAVVVTPLEVLTWRRDELLAAMAHEPTIAQALLATVAGNAELVIERLEEVATVPVAQRLARSLLRFHAQVMRTAAGGAPELPLSRQDLADLIAATLPTVSRTMSLWRQEGIVGGRRGHVSLLDRAALAAIAEAG